jgi:hypothetical protein
MGAGFFPRRNVNHPPPSKAEVKERVELYLYYTSVPSWQVIGRDLTLPHYGKWIEDSYNIPA